MVVYRLPFLRNQATIEAKFAKETAKMNTRNTIGLFVLAALIIGSLGFFHIIMKPFCFIPKEHFSFALTFVDVDEVVSMYNSRDVGDRLRGDVLLDHLVNRLSDYSIIQKTGPEPISQENLGL